MQLRPSHIEAKSQSTMQFLLPSPNSAALSALPLTRTHSSREQRPRGTLSNFSQEKGREHRNLTGRFVEIPDSRLEQRILLFDGEGVGQGCCDRGSDIEDAVYRLAAGDCSSCGYIYGIGGGC